MATFSPEAILQASWTPVDETHILPEATEELHVWTPPGDDQAKRTLSLLRTPAGRFYVRVERPDGTVTQLWLVETEQ